VTPEQRFWHKVDRSGECWLWIGTRNPLGYGRFWVDGRMHNAHRWLYEQTNGELSAGLQVLHSCDNPPCVCLDHLFVGTREDNMQDASRKGRLALQRNPDLFKGERHWTHRQPERRTVGERHGSAKLTWEIVAEIREDYAAGAAGSQAQLAHIYGVHPRTVNRIIRNETWVVA